MLTYDARETFDYEGNKVMVINPDLPKEFRKKYEQYARSKGIRIADLEKFPKLRGKLLLNLL